MQHDEPTGPLARRVLVVATGAVRDALFEPLRAAGFEVLVLDDPLALVPTLKAWRADLVLVQEVLAARAGRQVVLSLRAEGELFSTPIVGVLDDVSVGNVLQWLRVGATDLWQFPFRRDVVERTRALIDECERARVQLAPLRVRLLAWLRRWSLSGTVTTSPGTPFEGRATFVLGELREASFANLEGERALDRLCEFEGGEATWDEGLEVEGLPAVSGYRPRVLLIEDEPTLRALLTRQLERGGYVVAATEDGQEGLQRALQQGWDLAVVDLDVPVLDGWGVLRTMRADVSLREIGVLLLSAQEQAVDTLKVSRAGARAYLKKSGRSKELLDTVGLLAAPRVRAWNALSARRGARVQLRALGPLWVLRTLAELDCQGRLELEDALGRYEVRVAQGQLLEAVAQVGSLRLMGTAALEALVASRGEGRFVFESSTPHEGARWIYEAVDELCALMRREEERKLREATRRPGHLLLDPELGTLFARVASLAELKVLEAVKSAPGDLPSLARAADLPPEDAEQALAELVRRGVLQPLPPG